MIILYLAAGFSLAAIIYRIIRHELASRKLRRLGPFPYYPLNRKECEIRRECLRKIIRRIKP